VGVAIFNLLSALNVCILSVIGMIAIRGALQVEVRDYYRLCSQYKSWSGFRIFSSVKNAGIIKQCHMASNAYLINFSNPSQS
jgi:hypothetical protein